MSIEHMTRIWKHSRQEGAALLLMLAVADYANDDGVAWPSMTTLAQRMRVDERTARRLVRKCQRDGELGVEARVRLSQTAGGKQAVNRYTILLDEGGGKLPPPLLQGGGTTPPQVGASDAAKGGGTTPPDPSLELVLEPSLEPSVGREIRSTPARRPRKSDLPLQAAKSFVSQEARRLVRLAAERFGWPVTAYRLGMEARLLQQLLDVGIGPLFLEQELLHRREQLGTIAWLHKDLDLRKLQDTADDAERHRLVADLVARHWREDDR